MTSLKHRHPTEAPESVEILDEQEQEEVIEDLRVQNDRANNFFKKALSFFSLLVMVLYLMFLYNTMETSDTPSIPLPTSNTILSYTPYPLISTICSISALLFSVYLLQARNVTIIHIYIGTFLSLVPNVLAIHTERTEKLWWGVPLGILILDVISLFLIKDSEQDIRSLEKLKYKYKGA